MPATRMFQPRPKATPKQQSTRTLSPSEQSSIYYSGGKPWPHSRKPSQTIKEKVIPYLAQDLSSHPICGRRPKMGWKWLKATIICQAALSFIGLCHRPPLPPGRGRHLTHTQAFQLLVQFAVRSWNFLQRAKSQTYLSTQRPVQKQIAFTRFL